MTRFKNRKAIRRKNILGFALILGIFYAGYSIILSCNNTNWQPKADLILDQDGSPKPCLVDLLSTFNIKHNGTLDDIVAHTQVSWLRKPGQERWDMQDMSVENLAGVNDQLRACGCIGEIKPALKQYDYVLVMGALASRMRTRIAYALQLWQSGVRFKKMIFLGGERPRNTDLETEDQILGTNLNYNPLVKKQNWQFDGELPKTEFEIMQILFDQAELPADFSQNVELVWVNAPMKLNNQGQLVRPTTGDTVNAWLELKPELGTCLVVTNNPYVGYQDSVARTLLPANFKVETVGHKDADEFNLAVYLDNLARWLHQEKQRRLKI
jgi:hypothetical protein